MKPKSYYIGYYDGKPYCVSTKKKAVKSYMHDNRKLSSDQYDIDVSMRNHMGDKLELVECYDRYVTLKEFNCIVRDYDYFMDNAWDTIDNLHTMLKVVPSSRKNIIKETIGTYLEIFTEDDGTFNSKILQNFFLSHIIVNMSMTEYIAYTHAFPDYFNSDRVIIPYDDIDNDHGLITP